MRFLLFISMFTVLCLLTACSENTNNAIEPQNAIQQIAVVECSYQSSYRDSNGVFINQPNVRIEGKLYSDQYPEYIDCIVNSVKKNRLVKLEGYTKFGDIDNYKLIPVTSSLDTLNISVNSSFGKLDGKIVIPDIPGNIQLSVQDTLPLNTPLTINWQCNNSIIYQIKLFVDYKYDYGGGHYDIFSKCKDTLVTGNQLTVPGSFFNKDGEVKSISIKSYNGAFPNSQHSSNMTGDGLGFMCYTSFEKTYQGSKIIIGSGLNIKRK